MVLQLGLERFGFEDRWVGFGFEDRYGGGVDGVMKGAMRGGVMLVILMMIMMMMMMTRGFGEMVTRVRAFNLNGKGIDFRKGMNACIYMYRKENGLKLGTNICTPSNFTT